MATGGNMATKTTIRTNDAPGAIGPYVQGVQAGNLLFVSGQVPMDPVTKTIVLGEFEDRARQCILNVQRVLQAAGCDLEHAVKVTVFLTDLEMFSRLNAVYREYWGDVKPARSCIEVSRLPMNADVEIEAIAVLPG